MLADLVRFYFALIEKATRYHRRRRRTPLVPEWIDPAKIKGSDALRFDIAVLLRLASDRTHELGQAIIEHDEEKRRLAARRFSVSALHCVERTRVAIRAVGFLTGVTTACFLFGWWLGHPDLGIMPLCVTVALGLLWWIDSAALSYRIRHGYYGDNESEARELVAFILDNGDKLGPGGHGKRCLMEQSYAPEGEGATYPAHVQGAR